VFGEKRSNRALEVLIVALIALALFASYYEITAIEILLSVVMI